MIESVTASSMRYTSDWRISFMCEFASGIKTRGVELVWVRRDRAPGTPDTYLVEGNTKNGSDLGEKLTYLAYELLIRN